MKYSTNFNMNKPELNEQYSLSHWNDNTDIIDTEMQAIRSGTDEVMKATLLNFCYPIGSLYWSSKSTNPSSLFGGTWVQIKDRFVLACGDTYKTVGATGGASSVTLSVSNMPSHTHSFTPSGTVSSTFTGSPVTTSTNGAHSHTTNSTNKNLTGNYDPDKKVGAYRADGDISNNDGICSKTSSSSTGCNHSYRINGSGGSSYSLHIDATHSHGTDSKGDHNHTLTANGTVSSSFTGTSGPTSSSGSGTAFSILPPYVVKYCWERTA